MSSRKDGATKRWGIPLFHWDIAYTIEISIGGGNACAACGALFIFSASIMNWDFIGSIRSPGGHDATKISFHGWNQMRNI